MLVKDLILPETLKKFKDRVPSLTQYCFYEESCLEQMVQVLQQDLQKNRVLVFADQRTYPLVGDRACRIFSGSGLIVEKIIIPDSSQGDSPVCDDVTKNKLRQQLPDADIFLAVGSGVVNDLTKWFAAEAEKPYAVIATAASMNGYTAANVAPMIDGVKALFRAKSPVAVAALPEIIEHAPFSLTASGLGDVIAKPVSTADWLVNDFIFGEDFNQEIADIISAVEPVYLNNAAGLRKQDPKAVKGLFDALILSGCAMTLQGSSLPASGGEHLISHTLDIKAHLAGKKHDLHGRQVGVSSILAAAVYQRLLHATPRFNPHALVFDESYWGKVAGPVKQQYSGAIEKSRQVAEFLSQADNWDKMMAVLRPILRTPESIKECLKTAGAAHRLEDIGCSREHYRSAVINCGCMRERFTSMDLGFLAGILPGCIDEIIDEFLVK